MCVCVCAIQGKNNEHFNKKYFSCCLYQFISSFTI